MAGYKLKTNCSQQSWDTWKLWFNFAWQIKFMFYHCGRLRGVWGYTVVVEHRHSQKQYQTSPDDGSGASNVKTAAHWQLPAFWTNLLSKYLSATGWLNLSKGQLQRVFTVICPDSIHRKCIFWRWVCVHRGGHSLIPAQTIFNNVTVLNRGRCFENSSIKIPKEEKY